MRRAFLDVVTSVVPYMALLAAMFLLVDTSYVAVLVLAVPTAGFLTRTFLVMHDCAHGAFLPSRRANQWLGVFTGIITLQAFACWRHDHIRHHAAGGDLSADGTGDVEIISVSEFRTLSRRGRLVYYLRRHPLIVFSIGAFWANVVKPRIVLASDSPRLRRSKLATNLVLAVMLASLGWLVGWRELLLVGLPTFWLASGFGVWLIWVQHRFEDALWLSPPEWDWDTAALAGSSHFKLPRVLQFFSLNIGLHHVHHLNPRIPNYNLSRANAENEFLRSVPTVSLLDGLKAVRLCLYDVEQRRLVTFSQARRQVRAIQNG
ncbi:MAG TPA: fatty acid desaturase [Solirubrobacteraceae bacterium]|nr:fatty acid desaturase [Solirubrobacteraceae bacterium]